MGVEMGVRESGAPTVMGVSLCLSVCLASCRAQFRFCVFGILHVCGAVVVAIVVVVVAVAVVIFHDFHLHPGALCHRFTICALLALLFCLQIRRYSNLHSHLHIHTHTHTLAHPNTQIPLTHTSSLPFYAF